MLDYCRKCGVDRNEDTFYKNYWSNTCKVCIRAEQKIKRDANKEKWRERARLNRLKEDKEKVRKYQAEYRAKNKEKAREYSKEWREKNKDYIKESKREYVRNRRSTDPLYKLRCNVRSLIKNTFIRNSCKKAKKTEEILGCTMEFFIEYITSQFTEGMSLDNYGSCKNKDCERYWELDHIYPVSKAVSEEHLLKLNHYTNFRPLWKEDNILKYNKIEPIQLRLL